MRIAPPPIFRQAKGHKVKIGIMQPYFFPYLGYYDLINRTDRWIVFDVVDYAPKSWMNRNRILHPAQGCQYVSVPVDRHAGDGIIQGVEVLDVAASHGKIRGQIAHYRKGGAPYFRAVERLLDDCFLNLKSNLLRDLNVRSLELVCAYLAIPFKSENLSQMSLSLPEIRHPGQWALEIASAVGADDYLNPPGGRDIFQAAEWTERGVRLGFTRLVSFPYLTKGYQFIEHLSILDVLMWNPPEKVKAYLDSRMNESVD